MKKTVLMAMVLAGLIVPSALIAQAVVLPDPQDLEWWKLHHGVPPVGSIRPLPTPVPRANPPAYRFPTPVPHGGNPPRIRPSPPPMPTSGPGVFVPPPAPAPVPVRPNPPPYRPLVIAPPVVTLWDPYQFEYEYEPLPPENGYGTNMQPAPPYADPDSQNSTPESAKVMASNWEVGMSGTPIPNPQTNTWDALVGFHLAYAWNNLYVSWDSIAVPAYMVQAWTGGYTDSSGYYVVGYDVPGFLNLLDVGLRLTGQPFVGLAEVGVNSLYVYQQGILAGGVGANIRVGAGLKFGFWGLSLTETSVYESWNGLIDTIGGLFSAETRAFSWNQIAQSLVPSLQLTFYF